jgi:cell division protein FtsZ
VRGARGVLINITASSRLGLHEVNSACSLIRDAAQNDDVQINFGVVMNEAMCDDVKITVIATGFTRDSLPAIERKGSRVAEPVVAPVYVQPEPEPVHMEAVAPEPVHEEAPTMAAPANGHDTAPFDDLDVPAILRRRMIQ